MTDSVDDDKQTAWNRDHRNVDGSTAYTTMATWMPQGEYWEARVWTRIENGADFAVVGKHESDVSAMAGAETMLQEKMPHDCDELRCYSWRRAVNLTN
jgi:hypothetical protein